jgi:hypothetical protein
MCDDTPMASMPQPRPSPSPDQPDRRTVIRRWAGALVLAAGLLVLLVVVVAAGWMGWLARHPGQAWEWVTKHVLASTLGVVVAALGVLVAWAGPRAQQRRTEAREDARRAQETAGQRAREDAERAQAAAERRQAETQTAAERRAARERRCRSLLALWPLPAIEEADPFAIGVFYSRRAEGYRGGRLRPPYVARALDAELAELLDAQPLILVKGQSRAGKSRTAYEVAARELAAWRLLVPNDRAALGRVRRLMRATGRG